MYCEKFSACLNPSAAPKAPSSYIYCGTQIPPQNVAGFLSYVSSVLALA
jgi:hypothetical protein